MHVIPEHKDPFFSVLTLRHCVIRYRRFEGTRWFKYCIQFGLQCFTVFYSPPRGRITLSLHPPSPYQSGHSEVVLPP